MRLINIEESNQGHGRKVALVCMNVNELALLQGMASELGETLPKRGPTYRLRMVARQMSKEMGEAIEVLGETNIFIDDKSSANVPELKSRLRRLKIEKGLDFVVIDYLQLMTGTSYIGNRVQEISEISRGLKELARELKIPIIALSQLSRNVEARVDKKPQLSDLRESGAIEQDADMVIMLYRDDYYDPDTDRK